MSHTITRALFFYAQDTVCGCFMVSFSHYHGAWGWKHSLTWLSACNPSGWPWLLAPHPLLLDIIKLIFPSDSKGKANPVSALVFFLFQSNLHKELPSEDKNHHSDAAVSQQGRTVKACPRLKDVSPVSSPSPHSHTHACPCLHTHVRTQQCNPKTRIKSVVGKNTLGTFF